jgi:hypothetical protein
MYKDMTKVILLILFIALQAIVFQAGCATQTYANTNDCVLSNDGTYYTCYYIRSGKIIAYKKYFQ